MRRVIVIAVLALAASAAALADAQTPAPESAKLHGFVCQKALDPGARGMSITAVMRPVAGTSKMQMRFELLRRAGKGGGRSVSLTGKGLKGWMTPPDPTLGQRPGDRWVVHHPVVELAAPDLYRFRVSFRWLGPSGKVIASAAHRSRSCFEPELRPDLAVAKVVPLSGNRYAAVVVNRGKTASGPFDVNVTLGSSPSQPYPESSLQPQARLQLPFACTAAEPITVVADPAGVVDDFDRSNNTLSETCPGATTSGTLRHRR